MINRKVDYHIHSSLSDGSLSPLEIAQLCINLDLDTFVITDHDSIGSYNKLMELKKTNNALNSYKIISGVELDCLYNHKEIHLLSYDFNPSNVHLNNYLKMIQEQRINKFKEQIYAINSYFGKIILSEEEFFKKERESYMKPLLIDKLIRYGIQSNLPYEEAYQNISKWLKEEIRVSTKIYKPPVQEMINLMKNAGGLCILAHPAYYIYKEINIYQMFKELKEAGLDGIEVNYPYHFHSPELFSQVQENEIIKFLEDLCHEFNFLKTSGSDSHNKEQIIFSNNHFNLGNNFFAQR